MFLSVRVVIVQRYMYKLACFSVDCISVVLVSLSTRLQLRRASELGRGFSVFRRGGPQLCWYAHGDMYVQCIVTTSSSSH